MAAYSEDIRRHVQLSATNKMSNGESRIHGLPNPKATSTHQTDIPEVETWFQETKRQIKSGKENIMSFGRSSERPRNKIERQSQERKQTKRRNTVVERRKQGDPAPSNSHPEASSRHVSEDPEDDNESFTEYVLKPHEEMEILDGWAKIKSPVRFALKARVLKKTETWEVMKNLKAENKVKYIYVLC